MKKLNSKVFWIVYCILTIFLLSVIIIFNSQDYIREVRSIENILHRMNNIGDNIPRKPNLAKPDKNHMENRIFMDALVYSVDIEDNKIINVFNHTDSELNNDEIKKIAFNILNSSKRYKLGCLYLEKYSYSVGKNNIIIVDHQMIRERLFNKLIISFIIFIILNIVIIIVSIIIANWVTKPVLENFLKQERFIADASHELKTPLSVIMANVDMIPINKKNEKWINNIKSESDNMNKLICDLLDLAKLEDDGSYNFEQENLSRIIEKTILRFECLIYENKINLEYDIQPNIMYNCVSDKIRQLISILIDNAIKHTLKNGFIKIKLYVDSKQSIVLEVRNNGEGIKKGDEEKIFERFYRADDSRNRKENRYGLGLSIAKGIVELHNAEIYVKQLEEYTVFIVKFK